MKACTVCKSIKDDVKFYKHSRKRKDGSFGLRSVCKTCTNEQSAKWQKNNLEKRRKAAIKCYQKNKDKYLQLRRESYSNMSDDQKNVYFMKKAEYRKKNRLELLRKQKEKYDPVLQSQRWCIYYKNNQEKEKARKRKYYYSLDVEGKQKISRAVAVWKRNNPEKTSAHKAIETSLKKGQIIKPEQCEICKTRKKLDAHHEDYEKPLCVVWLCRDCHAKKHSKNFLLKG